jgi:hypothetical protein
VNLHGCVALSDSIPVLGSGDRERAPGCESCVRASGRGRVRRERGGGSRHRRPAARRVYDTQPAQARTALGEVEIASRQTLSGLRRMLGALRQTEPGQAPEAPRDPVPGLADVDKLAEQTTAAGVRVDVHWRGEPRPLPPEIDMSAYRVIQEAVTNVVRHAGTDSCLKAASGSGLPPRTHSSPVTTRVVLADDQPLARHPSRRHGHSPTSPTGNARSSPSSAAASPTPRSPPSSTSASPPPRPTWRGCSPSSAPATGPPRHHRLRDRPRSTRPMTNPRHPRRHQRAADLGREDGGRISPEHSTTRTPAVSNGERSAAQAISIAGPPG